MCPFTSYSFEARSLPEPRLSQWGWKPESPSNPDSPHWRQGYKTVQNSWFIAWVLGSKAGLLDCAASSSNISKALYFGIQS